MPSRRGAPQTAVLALAVLVTIVTLAMGTPAGAQSYAGGGTITAPPTAEPGETITVSASGFRPGSEVTFTLMTPDGPLVVGTAIADANGVATLTFTVPTDLAPGSYQLVASGIAPDGSPLSLSTTITIEVAGVPVATSLPTTGSDVQDLLRVGALLIAAGAMLTVAVRKRSTTLTRAGA